VFFLFYATPFQRLALVVAIPLAVLVILSSLPAPTLRRITSFTASDDVSEEAIASSNAREYLLSKSIEYTVEHPVVGVGPGQFSEYEGMNNRLGGTAHGYWHETHNTFTQVSSECGIPALLFFVAAIVSSFALLNSTYRQVSSRVDCRDMRAMISCIILGLSAFCVGILFLSFAYMFYLPALGGLAISVSCAAREELARRTLQASVGIKR
jgi:O-antigen ligase